MAIYPLTFANIGKKLIIEAVKGKLEIVKHLESLGFVKNTEIFITAKSGESYIVDVRGSRIALTNDICNKIMVIEKTKTDEKTI